MAPTDEQSPESPGSDSHDELLGQLINEFLDRREAGEDPSEENFLAQYPQHADELRKHLRGLDLLEGLGSSSQEPTLPGYTAVPAEGSSARSGLAGGEPPPPEVPGYDVLRLIGRGGMGLVYKATQISTKREVALKVLLEGPLASEQARRRFEREISLAAQLQHPNIIPIYDSGSCDGRMYYAMGYVRGTSLDEHVKTNRLDFDARLRLFCRICRPVLHAHQRGVIHRDLKPSNILVDAAGEPHILDFGLAKAGTYIDSTTSITAQIVGTPAYMSPEQAAGDPSGIDLRTDVYSLGVVFYEMLTGAMPYDTKGSMGKVLDNIANAEPLPPSRQAKQIDSELTAIVLKALEKKKDARYQSVDAYGSDVARYIAGEPVSVKPPGVFSLIRKAARKHRWAVAIVTSFAAVALFASLVIRNLAGQLESNREELVAQMARTEQLTKDVDEIAQERDAAEHAQAAQQALLRNVDPKLAEFMETFAAAVTETAGRGEDLPTALTRILAEGLSDIQPPAAQPPSKEKAFNPDAPLMSRRPTDTTVEPEPTRKTEIPPEWLQLLNALKPPGPPAATTQPTSQPATTQPGSAGEGLAPAPTSRPATTQPARAAGEPVAFADDSAPVASPAGDAR